MHNFRNGNLLRTLLAVLLPTPLSPAAERAASPRRASCYKKTRLFMVLGWDRDSILTIHIRPGRRTEESSNGTAKGMVGEIRSVA